MSIAIIVLLVLALLLVIFTLQNTILISLNVFFWEVNDVPLILALLICLTSGFLLSFLFSYPRIWKLKNKIKSQQRSINELEKQEQTIDLELDDNKMEGNKNNENSFFKE